MPICIIVLYNVRCVTNVVQVICALHMGCLYLVGGKCIGSLQPKHHYILKKKGDGATKIYRIKEDNRQVLKNE